MNQLRRGAALLALFLSVAGWTSAQAQPPRRVQLPPGALHEVLQPASNGTTFAGPQDVTPPFGLQLMGSSTIVHTSTFAANGVLQVQNPSVVFQFPITPDVNGYLATPGGLHFAYKSIGWLGTLTYEACLTAPESAAWAGATPAPTSANDHQTCPDEEDLTHAQFIHRIWYQVASAKVDEYVVQNSGFVNVPTNIPVNLQQIDTPTRFHIAGYELFYTSVHTGPNDFNAACPQNVCNGKLDTRTAVFKTIVMPTALLQLKVLPQTIVYLPPGNASNASYKLSLTFSTTLTAGQITQVDNSQSNDQWMEDIDQNNVNPTIGKVLNFGYSSSTDTRWDNKTVVKTGQALERDLNSQSSQQFIILRKITATSVNVPGASGTLANAPFWGDLVVVLVHPQFALWDFYGKTTLQLIAASQAVTLPDELQLQVSELDGCAHGVHPFEQGIPFTAASGAHDVLTANDCRSLAALDPFYNHGQSADVTRRGTQFTAMQPYGAAVLGPSDAGGIELTDTTSQQISVTSQTTQTFASTVEDILATTTSQGLKLGLNTGSLVPGLGIGLENDITLKQGTSIDTSQTMTLTYKNSSAATFRTDVTFDSVINDTVNRGYSPQFASYLDNLFGGLMMVDPDAPAAPCTPQPICTARSNAGGVGNTTVRAPH